MHELHRIRLGKIASVILAIIAAFLGVYALMMLFLILFAIVRVLASGEAIAWSDLGLPLFLVGSLLVALAPFMAARLFYGLEAKAKISRYLALQVSVMMSVVAFIWGMIFAQLTYENVSQGQPAMHVGFQAVLSGSPALLAAICAWCAYGLRQRDGAE